MSGNVSVLVILGVIAFAAVTVTAALTAVSRRNEKRSGHQPAHRR